MRILIDTCIFIHLAIDKEQLSKDVLAMLTDYDNTICVSAETPRELIIQYNNGKVVSKFWKSARAMINSIQDEDDGKFEFYRKQGLNLILNKR